MEEKLIAEAYGVHIDVDGFEGDYQSYYQSIYKKLQYELS